MSIHEQLRAFYHQRAHEFQEEFKRLVPFGDMVSNRWEKARLLGFGQGTSIYDSALILGNVTVGSHTWIGPNVLLDGAEAPLSIGDYCSLSAGVQIYTHHTVKWAITGGRDAYEYAPVTVGSCVYFGPNAIVTKGVSIGNHVIVGAQSLVNKSLPDFAVAWGQPAKIVGWIKMAEDSQSFDIEYV